MWRCACASFDVVMRLQGFLEVLRDGLNCCYRHAQALGIHSLLAAAIGVVQIYFEECMLPDKPQIAAPAALNYTISIVRSWPGNGCLVAC